MEYIELDDFWEEDNETQKIIKINDGIVKLLDVLTAKQVPVRLASRKAGLELMAAIESNKRPEISDSASEKQAGNSEKMIPVLTEALEKGSCNFLSKDKIELLHDFFTGLKIGIE